jgi:hypothetical protein
MKIEKLQNLIQEAKKFPNAVIEYSCELPDIDTKGVKMVFNKDVPKSVGASIIYRLTN